MFATAHTRGISSTLDTAWPAAAVGCGTGHGLETHRFDDRRQCIRAIAAAENHEQHDLVVRGAAAAACSRLELRRQLWPSSGCNQLAVNEYAHDQGAILGVESIPDCRYTLTAVRQRCKDILCNKSRDFAVVKGGGGEEKRRGSGGSEGIRGDDPNTSRGGGYQRWWW